ncbi:MAG: TonB-dependent receptor, partial [Gemmatimonadetes bacterium]|nr:TonB-dependent receptor [Gemmatimonadota bacterium]
MTPKIRHYPTCRAHCAAALLMLAVLAATARAHGQTAGSLSGRVIDAGTGEAVADAVVSLEPAVAGLIIDVTSTVTATAVRTVVTGASGLYRFPDVAVGTYRLRIERIGYRSATVEVDVRRPADAGVSVGLELAPVSLSPVLVEQRAASLFQRASNATGELDAARLSTELQRQERFLSTDTRVLTYADVMDGVTLGGGDVFRALQRFAGVGTRDDYTAELWVRGAPWTETRVTLDGVPLFNPVHAVGVLSAITPEVLGSVHLHPGVRPPSIGEGAAGVVDMRTRPGAGDGELRGVLDFSTTSSKLVLDQRIGERGAWLVGARRSHLDVLTGIDIMGLDTLDLPYVFHDIAARVDLNAGGMRLEASGLWEQDRLEGDVEGVLERTRARWGNTAGSMTLHMALGPLSLAQSFGISRFEARTDERTVRTRAETPAWTEQASRNDIDYVRIAGVLAPVDAQAGAGWSAGYEVSRQHVDYDGSFPRYYAVRPDTSMRLTYARALTVGALWGVVRTPVGSRLMLDTGVRLESGTRIANGAAVRVSPRVALRAMVSDAQTLSVSFGRTWQHTQSIALAGPSIHPAFHATHFWLWADDRTPAVRADIINVGTERWLGGGWLAAANVYARLSDGLTLPDPTPGRLGRRPLFVAGTGYARGVEVSARRIGAAWSASFGYTYGVSEVEIADEHYPSSSDRRHVLDAMAGARVWRGLRAAVAFTSMTGAPFTRAYSSAPG